MSGPPISTENHGEADSNHSPQYPAAALMGAALFYNKMSLEEAYELLDKVINLRSPVTHLTRNYPNAMRDFFRKEK
jgi:hypothetical protein